MLENDLKKKVYLFFCFEKSKHYEIQHIHIHEYLKPQRFLFKMDLTDNYQMVE